MAKPIQSRDVLDETLKELTQFLQARKNTVLVVSPEQEHLRDKIVADLQSEDVEMRAAEERKGCSQGNSSDKHIDCLVLNLSVLAVADKRVASAEDRISRRQLIVANAPLSSSR